VNVADVQTVIATAITCRITMREITDLNRITFLLGNEVSDAPDSVDLNLGTFVEELLAQAMDVNFDSIGGNLAREPENMILHLLF